MLADMSDRSADIHNTGIKCYNNSKDLKNSPPNTAVLFPMLWIKEKALIIAPNCSSPATGIPKF
ncbi:hypothetical protein KSP40_PGU005098 [Platanthera guangdongensis]|uniref:Uncharacterized protein n=1 Tax=Platanthera guangdongensis TaxID=2320717 RepID=A0ABR2LC60_9ASPA